MMEKEKILIFGASGHSKLTIDIIHQQRKYEIFGIIDSTLKKGDNFEGYPVLGNVEVLPDLLTSKTQNFLGIIAIGDNDIRHDVQQSIYNLIPDFKFATAVHPSVIMGTGVTIGPGSIIAAGSVINNHTHIGAHCYMALKAAISHDSTLGDFSSLGPGVTTGGNVSIGNNTAICLGANILNCKSVGNYTVIGSGSLVVKNIGDEVVAYGVPAKIVRKRKKGDPYLS